MDFQWRDRSLFKKRFIEVKNNLNLCSEDNKSIISLERYALERHFFPFKILHLVTFNLENDLCWTFNEHLCQFAHSLDEKRPLHVDCRAGLEVYTCSLNSWVTSSYAYQTTSWVPPSQMFIRGHLRLVFSCHDEIASW